MFGRVLFLCVYSVGVPVFLILSPPVVVTTMTTIITITVIKQMIGAITFTTRDTILMRTGLKLLRVVIRIFIFHALY